MARTHHEGAEDGDVAVGGDERVAVGVTERRVWRQVDEHLEILMHRIQNCLTGDLNKWSISVGDSSL